MRINLDENEKALVIASIQEKTENEKRELAKMKKKK